MSQIDAVMVGNDFVLPKPRLRPAAPAAKLPSVRDAAVPVIPVEAVSQLEVVPVTINTEAAMPPFKQFLELLHVHSFIIFALLFLLVAGSGIEVSGSYLGARAEAIKNVVPALAKHNIAGLNLTVPASQLDSRLATITSQPATLKVGDNTAAITPATIKSWLKITPTAGKSEDYIHVDSQAMVKSLTDLANEYAVAPVNQVTVTHNGVAQVILAGQNGAKLTDPGTLASQAAGAAKSVMNGSGLNFSTPLVSQPFQAVTPAAFPKLIEADLTAKQVYAYQDGQLVNTFPSSDGKPSTPTPVGEFHIWAKLTSQTMTGPGYVQPNVPWVNYFDHSGDAVHGVYWRPASVFGAVNTSHGCVGLQLAAAKWMYDWAPIGTTVITHD